MCCKYFFTVCYDLFQDSKYQRCNFHEVRFVHFFLYCFWVSSSHLGRASLLQIYKTFFHIFFFQYWDWKAHRFLNEFGKLPWYINEVGNFCCVSFSVYLYMLLCCFFNWSYMVCLNVWSCKYPLIFFHRMLLGVHVHSHIKISFLKGLK